MRTTLIQMIERLLDSFRGFACQFNSTPDAALKITCSEAVECNEVIAYDRFRQPTDTLTTYVARVSAAQYCLVVRAARDEVLITLLPSRLALSGTVSERNFEPLVKLSSEETPDGPRWRLKGRELSEEGLTKIAECSFRTLVLKATSASDAAYAVPQSSDSGHRTPAWLPPPTAPHPVELPPLPEATEGKRVEDKVRDFLDALHANTFVYEPIDLESQLASEPDPEQQDHIRPDSEPMFVPDAFVELYPPNPHIGRDLQGYAEPAYDMDRQQPANPMELDLAAAPCGEGLDLAISNLSTLLMSSLNASAAELDELSQKGAALFQAGAFLGALEAANAAIRASNLHTALAQLSADWRHILSTVNIPIPDSYDPPDNSEECEEDILVLIKHAADNAVGHCVEQGVSSFRQRNFVAVRRYHWLASKLNDFQLSVEQALGERGSHTNIHAAS